MVLLIESGSSKTDWCLIDGDTVVDRTSTIGLNPYFVDAEKIAAVVLSEGLPFFKGIYTVQEIYFYGAGCSAQKMCDIVKDGLSIHFPKASIHVHSDMIAAARALCGNGPGFVAILGTGSNSCAYKDGKIIEQFPSLGFILGDEGSGSDLGKKILKAYCYNELKPELMLAFEKKYLISVDIILEAIYKKPLPNRFIASFVPFILENPDESFHRIVEESFDAFLNQHIKKFRALNTDTPFYATGSVAWVFRDILKVRLKNSGLTEGSIIQSPLEGLIKYHSKSSG